MKISNLYRLARAYYEGTPIRYEYRPLRDIVRHNLGIEPIRMPQTNPYAAYEYFNPQSYADGAASVYQMLRGRRNTGARGKRARWAFKGRRKTKSVRRSAATQRSITAPASRTIDTKFIDTKFLLSNIKSTSPSTYIVGELAQGTGGNQRVGNDVRVLKYIVSLELLHGSDSRDQTFRVVMVRWKTSNTNAALGASDVFAPDANNNYTPASLRNIDQLEDHEILLDQMIVLKNHYAASHADRVFQYQVTTTFGQRYSGSASTSVIRNPVHVLILCQNANVTTGASGQIIVRTIYSDVS